MTLGKRGPDTRQRIVKILTTLTESLPRVSISIRIEPSRLHVKAFLIVSELSRRRSGTLVPSMKWLGRWQCPNSAEALQTCNSRAAIQGDPRRPLELAEIFSRSLRIHHVGTIISRWPRETILTHARAQNKNYHCTYAHHTVRSQTNFHVCWFSCFYSHQFLPTQLVFWGDPRIDRPGLPYITSCFPF